MQLGSVVAVDAFGGVRLARVGVNEVTVAVVQQFFRFSFMMHLIPVGEARDVTKMQWRALWVRWAAREPLFASVQFGITGDTSAQLVISDLFFLLPGV